MRKFLHFVFELFLPATCFGCGKRVVEKNRLCKSCWVDLDFISHTKCDLCGYKFYHEGDAYTGLCGVCLKDPGCFDMIRSVCIYKGVATKMILALKYKDNTRVASSLASMMYSVYLREFSDIDIIVPVPVHSNTLRKRMYNQSVLLAKRIAKNIEKDCKDHPVLIADFLLKIKTTPKQALLSRKERLSNLRNSIAINKKYQGLDFNNKNFLIVDDVVTTCATIEECARVIKNSFSGVKVSALSFARTLMQG